jgi:tetratricopeptide (TPR) repeat protein
LARLRKSAGRIDKRIPFPKDQPPVTARPFKKGGKLPEPRADHSLGWRWALVIVLAAVLYRGLCFMDFGDHPLLRGPVIDASSHDEWARRIVGGDLLGHGPDDVFKPPLYSYFLALLYAVFGRSIPLVQWTQYALGSLSCLMAATLAARLLGRRVGLCVGILSAFYAPYVFFESQLLTPALSIFLNLGALLLLVSGSNGASNLRVFGAGALFGLSASIRPDVLLPAGLAAAFLLCCSESGSWSRRAIQACFLAAGIMLAILPITARNYSITGELIPVSSNGGINFYTGNHALADGVSAIPVGLRWERLVARVPQSILEKPAEASRWWTARAWEEMGANPSESLSRLGWKLLAFFSHREHRNNIDYALMQENSLLLRLPFFQYGLLLPLALCGMVILWGTAARPERKVTVLAALWTTGFLIVGMIFFVTARYRVPAAPLLMIPAAWVLLETVREARLRQWRSLLPKAALFFAAGLLVWPMWLGSPRHGRELDYINLGNVLRRTGDSNGAINAYNRALSIADDPDAHYLLANELFRGNKTEDARRHLESAMRSIPDSPDLLLLSANIKLASGDAQGARDSLGQLLDLAERSNLWPRRAQWASAHLLMANLDPTTAEEHWQHAWTISAPTAAEACFLQRKDMDRVLECFRTEALEKHWDWYSQANYGMALLETGRAQEAVIFLRRASALAPEKEGLAFQLARALVKTGDGRGALVVVNELLRTLPECPLRRNVQSLREELIRMGLRTVNPTPVEK